MKMQRTTLALAVLTWLAAGCTRAPALETRTFAVEHLAPHEVESLIGPYVYTDRPGAPGTLSATDRAVTVRETPDNLEKIGRVLEEFDKARPDLRLSFQVIEADGFNEADARIAEVETQLRKLFQFKGYRLAAEAVLTATNGTEIHQKLSGGEVPYNVTGEVYWRTGNMAQLSNVRLWRGSNDVLLQTSVAIRAGQTLVLGTSPKSGSTATLLLTVHAEPAES